MDSSHNPNGKRKLSGSSGSAAHLIGKRGRKSSPHVMELCTCGSCQQDQSPNPQTGMPSGGRYFDEDELKEHRKLERDRETARKMLNSITTPIAPLEKQPRPATDSADTRIISQMLGDLAKSVERAADVVRGHCAFFAVVPTEEQLPQDLSEANILSLTQLESNHPGNRAIIAYRAKLVEARSQASLHVHSTNSKVAQKSRSIVKRVDEEVIRYNEEIFNIWLQQSRYNKRTDVYDSSNEYLYSLHGFSPIVLACLFLALIFHLICGVSMEQCAFLLRSLHFILQLALGLSSSIEIPYILRSIPMEIRSVVKKIDLEPRKTAYVCCPRCFCLYWINPEDRHNYPERCTHTELGGTCGAKLRKSRRGRTTAGPAREYHTQSMTDYLARIYCREDLQPYLEGRGPRTSSFWGRMWWDIWDAPALHTILGPDGRPFLLPADSSEGRLIFSLNMDGFNPFGNKEAGKKVSVGGIYMVCLNLPMSIRYDLENMYLVGVIPGPQEPSLHQINHILKPLVDELLRLWNTGVYLTHTRQHPHGKHVRCALGPLVCDLPAARQMSGFSHFASHNFCSECTQTRDDLNNTDYKTWTPRNPQDHRRYAEAWKNAKTLKEREFLAKAHGVRWSELLRLPYWDPTKFTVIDSMHAFYLRLLQHHCRAIWGMGVDFDDGDGITFDPVPNQPTEIEMYDAHRTLECDTRSRLGDLRVAVLRQLCKDTTTLDFRGRKTKLLQRLTDFRIRQGWFTADGHRVVTGGPTEHANPRAPPISLDFTGYPVGQILRIHFQSDVDHIFSTKGKSYIKNMRKPDLITLMRYKVDGPNQHYAYFNKLTATELRERIFAKQKELGIVDEAGNLTSQKVKMTRVLGREVLREIRKDMAYTSRPSWLSPPPLHPGEQHWGKFTADQWRTFCLQVLPITLTRLWGSHPPESSERKRLDNFMELISAIKLATSRQMTPARIDQYEAHMETYLKSLLELYPSINLTPYQHLSLHFGPMLKRFGPTHSWRCNVFERYNYVMRQIHTNHKFGDLEKTLFSKFLEGQKLRSLLKSGVVTSVLHPFLNIFERFFKTAMAGTGLNNNLPYNDAFKLLDEEITWESHMTTVIPSQYQLLLTKWIAQSDGQSSAPVETHAFFRNSIHRLGQTYSTRQDSPRNSNISYSVGNEPQDGQWQWQAASITAMFAHTRTRPDGSKKTQTFVIVNNYPKVDDCPESAAYARYPIVGGKVLKDTLLESNILLSMDQVDSHFITCSFDDDEDTIGGLMVGLPLEKVKSHFVLSG